MSKTKPVLPEDDSKAGALRARRSGMKRRKGEKDVSWENLLGAVDLELRSQRKRPARGLRSALPVTRSTAKNVDRPASRSGPTAYPAASPRHVPMPLSAFSSLSEERSRRSKQQPQPLPSWMGGGFIPQADDVQHHADEFSHSSGSANDHSDTLSQSDSPLTQSDVRSSVDASVRSTGRVRSKRPVRSKVKISNDPPPQRGGALRVQPSGRRGPAGQSRFKGVCITRAGTWRAVIYNGRKQKYLGVFDCEFDAARAYDAAALELFPDGAKLNNPDDVERQLHRISAADGKPIATAGAQDDQGEEEDENDEGDDDAQRPQDWDWMVDSRRLQPW